jgi:hypothetical protein
MLDDPLAPDESGARRQGARVKRAIWPDSEAGRSVPKQHDNTAPTSNDLLRIKRDHFWPAAKSLAKIINTASNPQCTDCRSGIAG